MNKKFTKILICPAFLAGMMMFSCTEVEKIEYYTLGGAKLSEPVKGINIRKITYANGKTATDKVIK